MNESTKPKFILWNSNDGDPCCDDNGNINSSGACGAVTTDNGVFMFMEDGPGRAGLNAMPVGACSRRVKFRASGTIGYYDIWRIS